MTDIAFEPVGISRRHGQLRRHDPALGPPLRASCSSCCAGNRHQVSHISFSPDGSQLASYGVEGVVRIWALDLDDLIEIAQDRLTRSFTEEECRQYLHAERCPDPR